MNTNPTLTADFVKTVRLGEVTRYGDRPMSVYCQITNKDGRLSITGVEGPLMNGDCRGGAGQIHEDLSHLPPSSWTLATGWTPEALARFFAVWGEWHLNDMRAYNADMKAAGWPEIAARKINLHKFTLTDEAIRAKNSAQAAAVEALRAGETFAPTAEQTRDAARAYEIIVYAYPDAETPTAPDGYQPKRNLRGDVEQPESKTLGWVRQTEHPDGLLSRALHEGGPTYGGAWYREDVPADVLQFLRSLPDTDRKPAWV